jgi:acyl carrier protein
VTTLDAIREILTRDFSVAPEALQPEAKLDDLEIDSLAVIEVMFAVEDRFHITVPSEPAAVQGQLKTLGDLVAYIDKLIAAQHPAPASDA